MVHAHRTTHHTPHTCSASGCGVRGALRPQEVLFLSRLNYRTRAALARSQQAEADMIKMVQQAELDTRAEVDARRAAHAEAGAAQGQAEVDTRAELARSQQAVADLRAEALARRAAQAEAGAAQGEVLAGARAAEGELRGRLAAVAQAQARRSPKQPT